MANVNQLRNVKAGDPPSAKQHNIMVEAIKVAFGGGDGPEANTFKKPSGKPTRPDNQKFSRIAQFKVDEDPPTPAADRTFLMCVEMDGGEAIGDPVPVALKNESLPLSQLYTKGETIFAAHVIGDFGPRDADEYPIEWLEVVPPGASDTVDVDLSYPGEHTDTAATDTGWTIGDGGFKVAVQTGSAYNAAGSKTLYAFVRDFTYDSYARLVGVSAERRVSVDVTEACP